MKKTKATLVALSVLVALSSFGCSDDEDSDTRVIGARCTPVSFRFNGTDCQNNNVIACENNRVTETVCSKGCEIVNNEAVCIGGGGGSNCGNVTVDGMCIGKTLKYCSSEDNQLKTKVCDVACGEKLDENGDAYYDCLNDGPVEGCGNVSELGECNGNVAQICVNGELREKDCSRDGLVCQKSASSGKVDCISLVNPPVGDCGNIDELGVCDGKTLKYCEDGNLKIDNCRVACGDKVDEDGVTFKACIDDSPVDDCGDIDEFGVCDGNTLKYCEDGKLKIDNCPVACGDTVDNNGVTFKACIDDVPVNECGNIDAAGICDGKVRKYCDNGKLKTENCPVACGEKDDGAGNKIKACIDDGPVNECGNIDAAGICDGKVRKYCDNGKLKTENCPVACGEKDDGAGNKIKACIDDGPVNECGSIDAAGICDGKVRKYCDNGKLKTENCPVACGEKDDGAGNKIKACIDDGPVNECGSIDAAGICDGKVRKYCDNGKLKTENCPVACGEKDDGAGNKIKACIDDAPVPCGDIDALGVCEGKILKYCGEDGNLVVEDCAVTCSEVVDEEEGNYWACVDCDYIKDYGVCTSDGQLVYCEDDEPVFESCDDGCKMTSEDMAYCYVPCGDVDARGVCSEDKSEISYCDSADMLVTLYCLDGTTCGEVTDEHGETYYDCR